DKQTARVAGEFYVNAINAANTLGNTSLAETLGSQQQEIEYAYERRNINEETRKLFEQMLGIQNAQTQAVGNQITESQNLLQIKKQIALADATSIGQALDFSQTPFSPGQISQVFNTSTGGLASAGSSPPA
ncbi:MAG: hypothetical protein JZU65_05190, partial [Chlorobium sp.]|nr:hypothetical protein [Chlorobium sp.]